MARDAFSAATSAAAAAPVAACASHAASCASTHRGDTSRGEHHVRQQCDRIGLYGHHLSGVSGGGSRAASAVLRLQRLKQLVLCVHGVLSDS